MEHTTRRLAIITTHPIQYNAPLFRYLARSGEIELKVFYTWGEAVLKNKFDPGFGQEISWDVPLLNGYSYEFAINNSKNQGSHHFFGIKTPGLNKQIEDYRPDAILVYGWAFLGHLNVLWHFTSKVPIWFRGDSTLLDEIPGFSFKKMFRLFCLKAVYRLIDKAFYVGESNKNYFLKYGLKEEQLIFAPHNIDNTWFKREAERQNEFSKNWRQELGVEADSIVFLFVGKLELKKDPAILLSAFQSLNNTKCHLVFAGSGKLEGELKQRTVEARLGNRVHFLGFQNQSQMPAVYGLGDLLVLPSIGPGETWGLTVNEAMACGLPAITSDKVGCTINLIEEGVTGYSFQAGNADDLTNKLHSFLTLSETEQSNMRRLVMARIADFSIESVVKKMVINLKLRL